MYYYTEINPNSGGLLWPVSEKRISCHVACHVFSPQLPCTKFSALVLESFGSVHSSQLCVQMGQINLVLNYYLAIDLSTVELS